MVGPEELTETQLRYMLALVQRLGWSQQYAIAKFNALYTVHISSLADMSKHDASRFINSMKGRL